MKKELVSFNDLVPEMWEMLELEGPALHELVVGGVASEECPTLTACTTACACNSRGQCPLDADTF